MPEVSIIIPTFREAENLPILIPRIHKAAVDASLGIEIIIVDDNSRDGTQEACDKLREFYPVRLIVRTTERGLSSAVLTGMRAATGEILLVMDADLSHPPEKIPELVAALKSPDVDFVIGSRYTQGASTADDWGVFRQWNSRVATWLARPLTSANDPMAGFFALRRAKLEACESVLDPIGYKIGLELIVKCHCTRVVEVPIVFADRLKGESKLNLREQVNYIRHLKRLYEFRYPRGATFAQFIMVGCSGMVVDLSTYKILLMQGFGLSLARGLAIWVAMTWNFALNRRLTFSNAEHSSIMRQYLGFCASCLVGATVNWTTGVVLCEVHPFFNTYKVAAAFFGVVAGTVFNYLLCRHLVFKARKTTDARIDNQSTSKELQTSQK